MTAKHSSSILVYSGLGSHDESRHMLHYALKSVVDQKEHCVEYVTADQILEGSWMDKTCLIVFGGGYDLGFESAVGREGIKKIGQFVRDGGSYLGICAGGYWACDHIEFDKGGPLQVTGERLLKFYPGLCIGPAFPGFQYDSKVGACAALIKYQGATVFHAYSDGGGYFKPYQTRSSVDRYDTSVCSESTLEPRIDTIKTGPPAVDILGTYSSLDSTAIVKCRVGKGLAILSGVHLEFPVHLLDKEDIYLKPLLPKFVKSEDIRQLVFQDILTQLGVKILLPG